MVAYAKIDLHRVRLFVWPAYKNLFSQMGLFSSRMKGSLFLQTGQLSGLYTKIFTLLHRFFFSPHLSLFHLTHFNFFSSSLSSIPFYFQSSLLSFSPMSLPLLSSEWAVHRVWEVAGSAPPPTRRRP